MGRTRLPRLTQVVGKERDHHGPHAEVNVACGAQAAHTGIHERKASLALFPCLDPNGLWDVGKGQKPTVDGLYFHTGLHLKFLDKVAMPPQARLEISQVTGLKTSG